MSPRPCASSTTNRCTASGTVDDGNRIGKVRECRHARERGCMMRSLLRRGLLAAVLGLGMSGGLARAEEPAKALPLPSASTPYDGVLHQFPSSVVSEGAAPV